MQMSMKKGFTYTNLLIKPSSLISSVTKHNCTHCGVTSHASYTRIAIAVLLK